MKALAIYSNVDHSIVLERLGKGRITGCGPFVPPLTDDDVAATPTIVAQMGPEPFLQAMQAHPDFDVIIGGRAYDPAPYIAFSAMHALQSVTQTVNGPVSDRLASTVLGGFTHMGKIMECGGQCATPKSKSSMATVYRDGTFDVRPLAPDAVCTALSVAAHTLYEKSRPDRLAGPGGIMDLSEATYEALPDGVSVRVRGAVFESSSTSATGVSNHGAASCYTVKLEGARSNGYRSLFMGSFSDPILISRLPNFLDRVKQYVGQQHPRADAHWDVDFHIYGFDRDNATASAKQVFIVCEAVAETQQMASSVAATARVACTHGPYEGQKATSGNFGMGIGGRLNFEAGPCASFSIYHLMELAEGEEMASQISDSGFEGNTSTRRMNMTDKGLFQWEMKHLGSGNRIQAQLSPFRAMFWEEQAKATNGTDTQASSNFAKTNGNTKPAASSPGTLGDAAKIVRSKNAGPYEITLDVIFDDKTIYESIKSANLLRPERIAELYDINLQDIVYCGFFDQAMAFKVTIPRMRAGRRAVSGGFMEHDVHGSQAYGPLMGLQIDTLKAKTVNGKG